MARRKPRALDSVVYRSGDQLGAWSYALLSGVSVGVIGIAFAAVPISAAWLLNGFWLGRQQEPGGRSKGPLSSVPAQGLSKSG